MERGNVSSQDKGHHDHKLKHEISDADRQSAAAAHEEAEKDIEQDEELSAHSPNDDLDEGETARLGEDTGAII